MRRISLGLAMVVALALAAACGGGSSSSNGGKLVLWYGWSGAEGQALRQLIAQYNKTHSGDQVEGQFIGSNKVALQKTLTAVRGGDFPDVVYQWGSSSAAIAKLPVSVNLSDRVKAPGVNWSDFWAAERQGATVNGKIVGFPALVDNLAVVYNKQLLTKAGLSAPSASWTWDDFRRYAKAMTKSSAGQYGFAFPADGTENTVWRYEAMLWQAGGAILNNDNTQAAFASPAGNKALQVLGEMSRVDKSVYVDTTGSKSEQLFNSGRIGLFVTGPWDLPQFSNVKYGVQTMPSFAGSSDHQSISGPDNWVVLNHSKARVDRAVKFLSWLTAPKQVEQFSLATGDLPTRQSVTKDAAFMDKFDAKMPGLATFVQNMANVKQSRPATEQYPKVTDALAQAVGSVLLGKSEPGPALTQAAQQVDAALKSGS